MKYYIGVCIRKSGHAAVTKPYADLNECLDDMAAYCRKYWDDVQATTYMTRESDSEITLQDVFGKPASRDMKRNRKLLEEHS